MKHKNGKNVFDQRVNKKTATTTNKTWYLQKSTKNSSQCRNQCVLPTFPSKPMPDNFIYYAPICFYDLMKNSYSQNLVVMYM